MNKQTPILVTNEHLLKRRKVRLTLPFKDIFLKVFNRSNGFVHSQKRVSNFNHILPTAAKIISLHSLGLTDKEKAIENIFTKIDCSAIKDELHKWFVFGLIGNGKRIIDLTPEQLKQFANELPELIRGIYNYGLEQRKESNHGI